MARSPSVWSVADGPVSQVTDQCAVSGLAAWLQTYTADMRTVGASVHRGLRTDGREATLALTTAGWVVGVLVTALILFTPYLNFGHQSRSLHLVLNSIDACVALMAAYLVYGRYRREPRLQSLLLSVGLLLLAVAGIGVITAFIVQDGQRVGRLDVWLPVALRATGAVLIAASSMVGNRRLDWARSGRRSVIGPALGLAVFLITVSTQSDRLPQALDPTVSPGMANEPLIAGHPLLLAAQAFGALCFAVGSIAFAREAVRRDDELLRWLGPACALGAFARLNYLLFPSVYTDWFYTGDLLRTGFYLLLLVGATREIRQYWTTQAAAAVLEDRRRLARELHDGVMQELAYIRAESQALPLGGERVDRITGACDRAMDEARAAVIALGQAGAESLGYVLHRSARDMAARYGGHLEVELDDSVTADPEQQHALVRITREATSNAVRHGEADRVGIRLHQDRNGRQLVISDNGHGFDVAEAEAARTGFGLTSMRERAWGLPGSLTVTSAPTRTEVTVRW